MAQHCWNSAPVLLRDVGCWDAAVWRVAEAWQPTGLILVLLAGRERKLWKPEKAVV